MKKNKGFTLIELLAIIVILAIIAVITVPIILNIIENSRRGAVKDSAYGYKDAINKWYVSRLSENPNYNIASGTYSTEIFGDTTEGNKPDNNSYIEIENNNIINGCLQFDEYKVEITDGKINEAEKGTCEELETRMIINTDNKGRLYYNTEWINNNPVYLDPTNLENNCNENNSSSTTLTKSGCMKWYAYSENADGTVNMILDHNTTAANVWTALGDENYIYYNYYGPREALYQLYEDTKNWSGVNKLSTMDNYSISWEIDSNSDNNITDEEKHSYTIDYTKHLSASDSYEYSTDMNGHMARFIEAEEVAKIIGNNNWTIENSLVYFDESTYGKTMSAGEHKYAWLFDNLNDCERNGCNKQTNENIMGYWTSTPHYNKKEPNTPVYAYFVTYARSINGGHIYFNGSQFGIRPVVKVSKSIIGM